jgi:uncharacterized protein (DUF433 family)
MAFDWRDHFVQDPNICHGKTTLKGTRVMLTVLLANLAAGHTEAEIMGNYPSLTRDHIRAAIAFAASAAAEDIPLLQPAA